MGLRINTNIASIAAQRVLTKQQHRMEHAQTAIASGSRIVTASDDAAGSAIADNLKGQLGGIRAARQNSYNAISLIQVSEGGLNELSNILVRVRELGVQASSDTVSDVEREFIDKEAQQLTMEFDRIAKSTKFGNKTLLSGDVEEMEYHVGPFADEDENVIKYTVSADATASTLGVDDMDLTDKSSARETMEKVDNAISEIGRMRADFGAVQSRLQMTTSNLDVQYENLAAAKGRISDADIAYESSEMASAQVLQQASVAALAQANSNGNVAMRLLQ